MDKVYQIMHRVTNESGWGGEFSPIFTTSNIELCEEVLSKLNSNKKKRHSFYITTVVVNNEMSEELFYKMFDGLVEEKSEIEILKPKLNPGVCIVNESVSIREEMSKFVDKICRR